MKNVGHSRSPGRGCIFLVVIGAVFISRAGIALADAPPRAASAKPQPAIKSVTAFGRIPVSTLNLTLTSIVKGGGKNIAVISVQGTRDKLFGIGEAITPNVTLLAVDSTGAVISHDGIPEWLEFSRKTDVKVQAPAVTIPAPQLATTPQPRLFESGLMVAFTPPDAVQNLGKDRFSVKRSWLEDQVRSGDLSATAKLAPETGGGLRVSDIVQGSLYDTLGLKDGDKINTINGKPFKSVTDLMGFLVEQRDSSATAQVQIMRGDSLNNLQLDFH